MSSLPKVQHEQLVLGGRIAIWTLALDSLPASQVQEAAAELENLGYAALWFGEDQGREAFTNASLILSATRSLVVATGIAIIYARDAMAANAATMTLAEAYPGRFVLGLGVSHGLMVEQRGHAYSSPLSTMRDYLDRMDAAPFSAVEPEQKPQRLLAALGPKMLKLARERANGAHSYLVTPEHTLESREILGEGPLLAVEQAVIPTTDRQKALQLARTHLEPYLELPNYRNSWLRQGFAERDFADGGSERLAEALVAWGNEEAIRARVEQHLSAGANQICVQVITESPLEELQRWRELAPALLDR
jgi:probable F420-dependent oxidoreductase